MPRSYLIRSPRLEASACAGFAALAGIVLFVYLQRELMHLSLVALVWLLGLRTWLGLNRETPLRLCIDPERGRIELEQGGQSYFFEKYKVYPSRWFAILKLIDKPQSRNLFLNRSRFSSVEAWRSCRRDLCRLEQHRAA